MIPTVSQFTKPSLAIFANVSRAQVVNWCRIYCDLRFNVLIILDYRLIGLCFLSRTMFNTISRNAIFCHASFSNKTSHPL